MLASALETRCRGRSHRGRVVQPAGSAFLPGVSAPQAVGSRRGRGGGGAVGTSLPPRPGRPASPRRLRLRRRRVATPRGTRPAQGKAPATYATGCLYDDAKPSGRETFSDTSFKPYGIQSAVIDGGEEARKSSPSKVRGENLLLQVLEVHAVEIGSVSQDLTDDRSSSLSAVRKFDLNDADPTGWFNPDQIGIAASESHLLPHDD